jgi:hypothetical protein
VVGPIGLEPMTFAMSMQRASQLRHGPTVEKNSM